MAISSELLDRIRQGVGCAANLVLPPACVSCGADTDAHHGLCGDCWGALTFITAPMCACCGFPFEYDAGEGALCAACTAAPPQYVSCRSAVRYDDGSRPVLLAYKHGDRLDAVPALTGWLKMAGRDLIAACDVGVPVPLHWRRYLQRRFNQSALLVNGLARGGGIESCPTALVRTRNTPSQGGLSATGRRRNVQGAFSVRARDSGRIKGRSVLLIDDVVTTGATVEACARALKRGGAAEVRVLTLSRVVKPGFIAI